MQEQSSIKLAAGVLALILAAPLALTSGFAAGGSSAGIIVPLYTYPGGSWDTVASVKRAHSDVPIVAIVNPASGPGFSKDSNYESGIASLKSAGVTVIGYVSTAYTSRALSAVEHDIDNWKAWYPAIDGIFFDEQTNWAGGESYYSQADSYAKSKGLGFTVGNPGANSIPSYLDTVDVVLVYESPGLPNLASYQSWSSASNSKLGMIPFGVSSFPDKWVGDAASIIGWLYVTNDVLPNPWDSVTPYLGDLAAKLDGGSSPMPDPVTQHTLTITSVDQNGKAINGMWVEVKSGGTTVKTGFTPLSLSLEQGTYSVAASNYGQISFAQWSDGTTSSTATVNLSGDVQLTAHYNNGQTLAASITADSNSADAGSQVTFVASATGGSSPYSWSVDFGDGTSSPFSPAASASKEYSSAGTYSAVATVKDASGRTATSSPLWVTILAEDPLLTVRTADSNGSPINGYYTTLSLGGVQVQSSFSPAQFSLLSGKSYQVSVADYGDKVFARWDDGSTSRTRTVSIDSPTILTAYYGSKQALILVSSDDLSGKPVSGMWTVVKKDGATVKSGYTPLTLSGPPGTYQVTVSDYQNYKFDHWGSGSTTRTLQLAAQGDVKVTAYYSTGSTAKLTVKTAGLDGSPISGLWTVIDGAGSKTTGFSPLTYSAQQGRAYTVTVSDYSHYLFDHWENGSKDRSRTVELSGDTTLTAYYKK